MSRLRNVWLALAACRFLMALVGHSYLHPDEWMQSAEIISLPKNASSLPWEFQPVNSARSYFSLLLFYAPLSLIKQTTNANVLFYYSRVMATGCSFTVDWLLFRRLRQPLAAILFASAWPTQTFLTRPFSNTLETSIFALLASLLLASRPRWLLIGAMSALGCFVRITFPAFAAPLILYRLLSVDGSSGGDKLQPFVRSILFILIGAGSVSIIGMLVDGWYFTSTVSPLLAPLNNFIYNMNPANLAQHGIHPRYMHLVNLALLFGLALLLVRWPVSTPALKGNPAGGMRKSLAISCLFAISVLSVMPHQEPRFLLPVSVGLFACIPTIPRRFRRLFWPLWIVIQLSLIGLFGFWHQGGVVPCLRYLARQFPPSDAVIQCTVKSVLSNAVNRRYMENCTWEAGKEPASTQPKFVTRLHFWKVYTPPRFFLRDQIYSSNNSNNHHIELIDETGVKGSVIRSKYFNEAIPTDRFYFDSAKKLWVRDLIIAPAFYTREFDRQIDGSSNNLIKCGNDIHLGLDDIGLLSADSLYLRQHASPNDNQP